MFERLAGQYDAIFAELDIDRASYVSNYLGITSVPTFQASRTFTCAPATCARLSCLPPRQDCFLTARRRSG